MYEYEAKYEFEAENWLANIYRGYSR